MDESQRNSRYLPGCIIKPGPHLDKNPRPTGRGFFHGLSYQNLGGILWYCPDLVPLPYPGKVWPLPYREDLTSSRASCPAIFPVLARFYNHLNTMYILQILFYTYNKNIIVYKVGRMNNRVPRSNSSKNKTFPFAPKKPL